ncbi:MAG: sulfatase [Bradymonadaceae bacterium]|nr:sulfatase [Lujinxingiaceae bacterium]
MHQLFNGLRAGLFSALALTLWSFGNIVGAMEDAATSTGFMYVATAFGLVGFPQIIYGLALGLLVAVWTRALAPRSEPSLRERLEQPEWDLRVATLLLATPIAIATAASLVAGVHLAVTAKFVRPLFQAIGLGAATAVVLVAIVACAPLLYAAIARALSFAPKRPSAKRPPLTTAVLAIYAVGIVAVVVAAYGYAASLHVWTPTLLRMGVAGVLFTPAIFIAMARFPLNSIFWRYGLPLAGVLAGLVCFVGARDWAVSSPEMRQAAFRDSQLLAATARLLVPLPALGDNVFAFDDCDDDDPNCGNESKAIALSSSEHPARRSMALAIEAGHQAGVNKFQQIPAPPKNLVFILIDTLRQDHLGYAGYARNTSPNIDAIANEAVVFLDTYATSPHTPRSIPPMLFSQYASRMKWAGAQYNYPRVRPENLGMFEVLEERGYHNIGMTSHFYFSERQGIRQGFETWDNEGAGTIAESNDDIAAPRIWAKLEPVITELGQHRRDKGDDARPFSLFVHLFEPHARWIPHAEFDFGKGETVRERHINSYDSEIAYTDSYIAKIVAKLKAEGLYDDAIFVITSDHGEAFNEHGHYFHGNTLYNEVIKVPLIVRVPGWFSRRVEGPVSIIDIAPTLLDLFKATIPAEFEGVSLTDVMLGRSAPPLRPLFAELLPYTHFQEHHRTVIYGHEKFIQNFTLGIEEYYDLGQDPGEQTNLRAREPERANKLKEMLREFMERP